jgi:hypothetical protein
MRGGKAERLEAVIDRLAAALFAGAIAYAFFRWLSGFYGEPQLGVFSMIAAAMAFLLCERGLRRIPVEERFDVPAFDLPELESQPDAILPDHIDEFCVIEPRPPDELLLTDADRIVRGELLLTETDQFWGDELSLTERFQPVGADELVLDDILAELTPDSRVVRLFDPAAMPTPAQLNARIERHLGEGNSAVAPPDASQALYDALTELRRSLR